MLLLAIPRKFKIFFEKGIYFSFKKTSHMNVFSFFTNWVAFYGKFALFSDFKNIQDFFQKSYRVFLKNSISERFENFRSFSRKLQQICYFKEFKKNQDFFRKTYIFSKKPPKIWPFSEFLLFQSDSTANLILLEILKKLKTVSHINRIFFRKTPFCEHFEESYFFNCILQKNS